MFKIVFLSLSLFASGFVVTYPITELADETTMTDSARKLFYSFQPSLVSNKDELRSDCADHGDKRESLLYGCFNPTTQKIYINDISDKRLQGAKTTTAAHELLHAIYLQLPATERARIDKIIMDFYSRQRDGMLAKRLEIYKNKDEKLVPGELHSILGSEAYDIPAELETHYAKFFKNRKNIVAAARKTNSAFSNLEHYIKDYEKDLERLKFQIEMGKRLLDNHMEDIDHERTRLNDLKESGDFEEYNRGVEPFNERVNRFKDAQKNTNELVAKYNDIVRQRNSIASEHQSLVKEITGSNIDPNKK
jgi:hypothetical protein